MPSFQVPVLGSLFVSFHPSRLRSHSCSTGASLLLSLSGHPLSIHFLSSASLPVPTTQPLLLPFLFLPVSASQWLPRCSLSAFASLVFPVLSDLVSHVFFPGSSYSAFCSFPFVPPGFAPTAVPPVLPLCFRFRALPFRSVSFRPLLFRFLLLSFLFFLSFSSRFRLTAASPMPVSALASSVSSFSPA